MAIAQHDAVMFSFEGPRPQRRVTVGFRVILAIPHVVWMVLVGIAAGLAVFIGWFAALFTGRLPIGLASFIARYLQYMTRVYTYMLLLTDRYPSFSLGSEQYPVELELDEPPRLNRAAVLFRFVLLFPVLIASQLVTAGLFIVMFFVWLIVLLTGRTPSSVFEAELAVTRYQMRVYSYVYMLTSQYPRGLFGDKLSAVTPAIDEPASPPAELPSDPRITRLELGKAAKRLVVLFIVLGVLSNAASGARVASLINTGNAAKLATEHKHIEDALQTFLVDAQGCAVSAQSGGAECLHSAISRLVVSFETFQTSLRDMSLPAGAQADAQTLDDDLTGMTGLLKQMQATSDLTTYQSLATRFQDIANKFDSDYQSLLISASFG